MKEYFKVCPGAFGNTNAWYFRMDLPTCQFCTLIGGHGGLCDKTSPSLGEREDCEEFGMNIKKWWSNGAGVCDCPTTGNISYVEANLTDSYEYEVEIENYLCSPEQGEEPL